MTLFAMATSKIHIELETKTFRTRQMFDTADISRNLQRVLDAAQSTWTCLDHSRGLRGHDSNDVTHRLESSDGHLIARGVDDLIEQGEIKTFAK